MTLSSTCQDNLRGNKKYNYKISQYGTDLLWNKKKIKKRILLPLNCSRERLSCIIKNKQKVRSLYGK